MMNDASLDRVTWITASTQVCIHTCSVMSWTGIEQPARNGCTLRHAGPVYATAGWAKTRTGPKHVGKSGSRCALPLVAEKI